MKDDEKWGDVEAPKQEEEEKVEVEVEEDDGSPSNVEPEIAENKKNEEPKEHDLLVLKAVGPKDIWPCHLSIHVGHDKVLMQTNKRKSGLIDYEPVVKKNLLMIFRPNFV